MTGPRPWVCRYCPELVTSLDPAVDYCRFCWYSGAVHATRLRVLLDELDQATGLGPVVWHTGGGSFAICVPLAAGPEPCRYLLVTLDQGASLPDQDTPDTLWWIGHYADEDLAQEAVETICAEHITRAELVDQVVRHVNWDPA